MWRVAAIGIVALLGAAGCRSAAEDLVEPARAERTTEMGHPHGDELSDAEWLLRFTANVEIARGLVLYDHVAWLTSDALRKEEPAILEKLGREWFCYERDGSWHAVYGKYDAEEDVYDAVLCYSINDEDEIVESSAPLDEAYAVRAARAIHASTPHLERIVERHGLRMNTYVRELPSGELEVWYLPAILESGRLIHGGECLCVYDPERKEIVEVAEDQSVMHVFAPDPEAEILLQSDENDVPTVGDLFFYLYFIERFKSITIRTRHHQTSLVETEDGSSWVHIH